MNVLKSASDVMRARMLGLKMVSNTREVFPAGTHYRGDDE
jgi:hypothetical protein